MKRRHRILRRSNVLETKQNQEIKSRRQRRQWAKDQMTTVVHPALPRAHVVDVKPHAPLPPPPKIQVPEKQPIGETNDAQPSLAELRALAQINRKRIQREHEQESQRERERVRRQEQEARQQYMAMSRMIQEGNIHAPQGERNKNSPESRRISRSVKSCHLVRKRQFGTWKRKQ